MDQTKQEQIDINDVNWNKVNTYLKRLGYDVRGAEDVKDVYFRLTNKFTKLPKSKDHIEALEYSITKKEQSWETKAKRYFGLTRNLDLAGYLLTDGSLLDLSGRKQGNSCATQRVLDHREINSTVPDNISISSDSNSKYMWAFIARGNIRINSNGIDLAVMPTSKQWRVLREHILMNRGESYHVDISNKKGEILASASYEFPEVSVSRIVNDISNMFSV